MSNIVKTSNFNLIYNKYTQKIKDLNSNFNFSRHKRKKRKFKSKMIYNTRTKFMNLKKTKITIKNISI